jgi:hypothetical protein
MFRPTTLTLVHYVPANMTPLTAAGRAQRNERFVSRFAPLVA